MVKLSFWRFGQLVTCFVYSCLFVCILASVATAEISQSFTTDTTTYTETRLAYPTVDFSTTCAIVDGGALYLDGHAVDWEKMQYATFGAFEGDLEINCQVSAIGDPNWSPTGLKVGEYFLAFHPGYSNGGFHIYTESDYKVVTNQNMGFTPVQGVLQDMAVDVDITAETFDVNIGSYSYTFHYDPTLYVPGTSTVGVMCHGYTKGMFDNFVLLQTPTSVPEPGTWVLLVGLFLMAIGYRKRK